MCVPVRSCFYIHFPFISLFVGIVVNLCQRCCVCQCSFISVIGLFEPSQPTSHLHRLQCAPIAATIIGRHRTVNRTHTHIQTNTLEQHTRHEHVKGYYCLFGIVTYSASTVPLIRYSHSSACQYLSIS